MIIKLIFCGLSSYMSFFPLSKAGGELNKITAANFAGMAV